MAHAAFRYADHPHARLLRIDTTEARAVPGVAAVITQDDLPDVRFGGLVQDRTLFAKDVVRFEGETSRVLPRSRRPPPPRPRA